MQWKIAVFDPLHVLARQPAQQVSDFNFSFHFSLIAVDLIHTLLQNAWQIQDELSDEKFMSQNK